MRFSCEPCSVAILSMMAKISPSSLHDHCAESSTSKSFQYEMGLQLLVADGCSFPIHLS